MNGRVALLGYLSHALFFLGELDRSDATGRQAVAEAEAFAQPYSLAMAWSQDCRLQAIARRSEAALARAEALLRLAREHSFPLFVATATAFRGWALAYEGDADALELLAEGIARFRALGSASYLPLFLALQAECLGKVGEVGRGLTAVTDGLELSERTGERVCEAELHRVLGRLLAATGGTTGETALGRAVAVARAQRARTWELRATCDLAALLRRKGRAAEARAMLAPVYASFADGFGFPDLVEARAVLDELDASPALSGPKASGAAAPAPDL